MNQKRVRRAFFGSKRATYALKRWKREIPPRYREVGGDLSVGRPLVFQGAQRPRLFFGGTTSTFPCPGNGTKIPPEIRRLPLLYKIRAPILPSPRTKKQSYLASRLARHQTLLHGTVSPPSGGITKQTNHYPNHNLFYLWLKNFTKTPTKLEFSDYTESAGVNWTTKWTNHSGPFGVSSGPITSNHPTARNLVLNLRKEKFSKLYSHAYIYPKQTLSTKKHQP